MHDINGVCPQKPQRVKKPTEQTDIRSSHRWTKKSLEIRERDKFLCRLCLAEGKLTYEGVEVHHIIPLEEDASLAFDNELLLSLCTVHHKQADRGEIDRRTLRQLACAPIPPIVRPAKR